METIVIAGIVAAALIALVLLAFGRMAWRILRGDETMQPGGSYGRQSFGRLRRRG